MILIFTRTILKTLLEGARLTRNRERFCVPRNGPEGPFVMWDWHKDYMILIYRRSRNHFRKDLFWDQPVSEMGNWCFERKYFFATSTDFDWKNNLKEQKHFFARKRLCCKDGMIFDKNNFFAKKLLFDIGMSWFWKQFLFRIISLKCYFLTFLKALIIDKTLFPDTLYSAQWSRGGSG